MNRIWPFPHFRLAERLLGEILVAIAVTHAALLEEAMGART